jgi:hypothetical protein
MIDSILKIFSKPKPTPSDESRAFITKLAAGKIWILGVGIRGTPAIPRNTDLEGINILAAHRIPLSEISDDDSVFPFNYERAGRQTLPFFSSVERVQQFVAANDFPTNVTFFEPYSLRAGFVAAPDKDMLDVVLDACSPAERTLTREERLFLRAVSRPSA